METPRGARAEFPGVLSASRETQLRNATRFVDGYLTQLRTPLALMNHVAVLPFESQEDDIQERYSGLAEYLTTPPLPAGQWMWGRTLIAEVVSQQVMQASLGHTLESAGMYVTAVPTTIDDSSKKDETPPKKGVDMAIVQMLPDGNLMPVCGVDVTTGKNTLVKAKRKRPALQCPIAMPAVVIPLGNFLWDGRKNRSFAQYIDDHARRQILEHGVYTPFYGLEEQDVARWKNTMRQELLAGLAATRGNLEENFAGEELANYPYKQDVLNKIALTEELVHDAQQHSPFAGI